LRCFFKWNWVRFGYFEGMSNMCFSASVLALVSDFFVNLVTYDFFVDLIRVWFLWILSDMLFELVKTPRSGFCSAFALFSIHFLELVMNLDGRRSVKIVWFCGVFWRLKCLNVKTFAAFKIFVF
jgi:hypothetical protein